MSPARAADLGGDCCADLEERVAELEATTARKGNRRVSLTISGQVSTSVMAWDDGRRSDTYVVDNVMSGGTQFSLTGSARINPNVSAGFNITIAMDTGGRGHQVSQDDDDGTANQNWGGSATRSQGGFDTDIVLTLANWYLDHKHLGRVTVGRINTSTAGISTIDLGGAGVIANASVGYTQRGFFLVESGGQLTQTWAAALGGNTVNGASLSRAQAIQYTSPTMAGFSVSGSWGEDDLWDVALRYAGEWHGFRLAAGVGYIHNGGGLGDVTDRSGTNTGFAAGAEPNQWKGSASVLHVASGIYLTGAYVNQDWDTPGRPDTTLWYVQAGIGQNWTGLGKTVFYGEYAQVDDPITGLSEAAFDADGLAEGLIERSRAKVWGIGVVQHIDAAAMEVFLSYKRFSFDAVADGEVNVRSFSDFDVVIGGARIRF